MSHVLVIGAGPAGLMAADVVSAAGHHVTVVDQMPSVGRKFLMAGKSGLNLTKADPVDAFLNAYGAVSPQIATALKDFGPDSVQDWARELGQEIFTGSTGRVFPKAMKASPLLRAWLARLADAGVIFHTRWQWHGWRDNAPTFTTPNGPESIQADAIILATGGGSWARLGSDGLWAAHLDETIPFQPSNCGFAVDWTAHMAPVFGQPVKATKLQAGEMSSRGEWIISARGIEGGGVYTLSAALRDGAPLTIDLMPDLSAEAIAARIARAGKKASRKQRLAQVLRLPKAKVALFNECTKDRDLSTPAHFAGAVKSLALPLNGPLPMDEAISTVGGLRQDTLTAEFMLTTRPGVFAAGEMIDWDAPTGGYLMTGCLAMGRAAGKGALHWLNATTNHGDSAPD